MEQPGQRIRRWVAKGAGGRVSERLTILVLPLPSLQLFFSSTDLSVAGKGDWAAAAEYYGKATQLAPQFSFAQVGRLGCAAVLRVLLT